MRMEPLCSMCQQQLQFDLLNSQLETQRLITKLLLEKNRTTQ